MTFSSLIPLASIVMKRRDNFFLDRLIIMYSILKFNEIFLILNLLYSYFVEFYSDLNQDPRHMLH